jgi:uncharacterized protein (TIGR03083 family)
MARKNESPLWTLIENERRTLANDLNEIGEAEFAADSGLDGWTAKHVLAHAVMPFAVPTPRFLVAMLRRRGNIDLVNVFFADRLVKRPAQELIAHLNNNAASHWTPPGFGPELPLTEVAVHGQDIRAALGLRHTVPSEVRTAVLDNAESDDKTGAARRDDYARRLDAPAVVSR